MIAYTISAYNLEYSEHLTRAIVRFFSRYCQEAANMEQASEEPDLLLIRFKHGSVLYSRNGYDEIEGNYEVVSSDGVDWLASSEQFLDSKSLRQIETKPFRIEKFDKYKKSPSYAGPPVSVIIPIYGSPKYTLDIRNEIEAFLPELTAIGGRVIISIDGHSHPAQTSLHLDVLKGIDEERVQVHSHNENLGFIKNVNFLYEKTLSNEIVVLMTTDVKMRPGSLTRVIAPLVNSTDIALSTPFAVGGENLEVPKSSALHWHDVDAILSSLSPVYPDAETNVGYMLAIDRRKYPGSELFDEFFVNGYGDDSDLYFRCVNLGFRGVITDNCCVFHEHGASFNMTQKRSELRVENYRRFMERWGEVYQSRQPAATERLGKLKSVLGSLSSALSHSVAMPQIVFLLPTNDRRIGGVAAVFDIVEGLRDAGLPAAIISRGTPLDEAGFASRSIHYDDTAVRDNILENASVLVATSHDTAEPVKSLAKRHNLKAGYFIQGPEFSFSDGEFLSSVVTGYLGFDAIFVVSRFLESVIKDHVDKPVTLIPYGPPQGKYYNLGIPREPKSIAIQLNGNYNKGAAFVAGVVASLAPQGYRIYSFGDDATRGQRKNFCKHLGFLSTAEKTHLFNRVEFYLDASNFEGLGLLLIESIRCGAIPLYRHNGGTADILKSAGVGIEVGDYAAIGSIGKQLSRFRESQDFEAESNRCKAAVKDQNLEAAVNAMLEWWNAQG